MELPCSQPNSKQLLMLDVREICFMDLFKGDKIRFYTRQHQPLLFRFAGSLETCFLFFQQFGFQPLDSVNVVNMAQVKFIKVNKYSRVAYFDDEETISTSVSKNGLRKVKEEFPHIAIIEE